MFTQFVQGEVELSPDMRNANGVILYEGPSKLDGAPIVVIATGLKGDSKNPKTGAMVQTYILRSDVPPSEAVKEGKDESVCGGCKLRGDGTGKGRACYVTLFRGPRAVYAAYKRGSYPRVNMAQAARLLAGKMVRLGAYGDPAAVAYSLWAVAVSQAEGWTGYTHQWRNLPTAWSRLVMASADSAEEMQHAHTTGYRTFRVTPGPFEHIEGKEVVCPASDEKGKLVTCAECKACMGTSSKAKVSIQIAAHGAGKRNMGGRHVTR